jgi:molybdopterin molybdotransferase
MGRALALNVKAVRDQPPFHASAMDGYAVRSADVSAVGAVLQMIGESRAGRGYRGVLNTGEAVRIFTGAPMPEGADGVLIQENAVADGVRVTAREPVAPGRHVRRRGLDFAKSEVVLESGRLLNARDIGLAASMGRAALPVRKRPRIAIIATGDELVAPGRRPGADRIVSSNNHALAGFAGRFGAEAIDLGVIPDDLKLIRQALRKARTADIVLITGGASVGEHDLVRASLEAEGLALAFWKIAMRPGKPMMFAERARGRRRILGLPGNPVSALVCARIFVKPLIDRLLGLPPEHPMVTARLGTAMPANDLREDYVRARLEHHPDGTLTATPFDIQDSSMQKTLARAGCLIIRPPHAAAAASGSAVEVLPLDF